MTPKSIIIIGPPGAGKGTQAGILSERLGWPHIDVGSLLRTRAKQADEVGRSIKKVMAAGQLLPVETVAAIVKEELLAHGTKGCLIDGFSRRQEQSAQLVAWAKEGAIPPLVMIELEVPEEQLYERIRQRRYCTACSDKPYPVTDARQATHCLRCGGHLTKREDDTQEGMKVRLKAFAAETRPTIAWLKTVVPTVVIDGQGTIAEVAAKIAHELQAHGLN